MSLANPFEVDAYLEEVQKEANAKAKSTSERSSHEQSRTQARDHDHPRRDRERSYSPRHRVDRGRHHDGRRSRERSPVDHYRPDRRDRRDADRSRHDRGDNRQYNGRASGGADHGGPQESSRHAASDNHRRGSESVPHQGRKSSSPGPTRDDGGKNTIFVQQLASQVENRHLMKFFESVGKVIDAQVVRDRISGRSKGVGYVTFVEEDSVAKSMAVTGQKLKGIPIIVSEAQAEKNHQVKTVSAEGSHNSAPFHRIFVGNIHFNITEEELKSCFEAYGKVESCNLEVDEKDPSRSKGHAQIQYVDPANAKEAITVMNGLSLAGRPIRVGLGNTRFNEATTRALLQQFDQKLAAWKANGGDNRRKPGDRMGMPQNDKPTRDLSALDDNDLAGYSSFNRAALMKKLARQDDAPAKADLTAAAQAPVFSGLSTSTSEASRNMKISNVFDTKVEEASGTDWVKEIQGDIEDGCNRDYGKVVHIKLQPDSDGDIYIRFSTQEGAENAMRGLNGRFFGERRLTASFVREGLYQTLFGRGKPLP